MPLLSQHLIPTHLILTLSILLLSQDKKQIGSLLNEDGMQKDYVENFAYKVFDVADNQDRAGHATKYFPLLFPHLLYSSLRLLTSSFPLQSLSC